MSEISTRSRGTTKKATIVPKLRKKVAPKLVSSRPKRNQSSPQNDSSQKDQESSETTQSNSSTQVTELSENSSSQTSLSSTRTLAESLSEDSNNIPLPTLPSEDTSTSIHTSLQLPLSTPTEIDLFDNRDPTCIVDHEDAIGGELLNLHNEQITMNRSATSTASTTSETSTASPTSQTSTDGPNYETSTNSTSENSTARSTSEPARTEARTGVQVRANSIVTCAVLPKARTVGEAVAAAGRRQAVIEHGEAAPVCGTSPQTTSEKSPVDQTTEVSEEGTDSVKATSTRDDQATTAATERSGKGGTNGDESEKVNNEKNKTNRKRSRADSTSKESGDQSPPSRPKRRRSCVIKERKAPDRTTMTMQELIYYNPSANPMQAAREERERRRGSTASPSPDKDSPNELETSQTSSTSIESRQTGSASGETGLASGETCQTGLEGGDDNDDRIVPQLTIGADGNIIIDEASMIMATTQSANPYNDSEAIIETSGLVTSDSFRKAYKITRWSKDETTKFFKALSHVGTDFTMMTLLVPNRSRKELKNKFKREEKKSPHLVAQALSKLFKVPSIQYCLFSAKATNENQVKVQKVSS